MRIVGLLLQKRALGVPPPVPGTDGEVILRKLLTGRQRLWVVGFEKSGAVRCYLKAFTLELREERSGMEWWSWHAAGKNTKMAATPDELDAEVARSVFGWKNIHQHENGLYGKKPDKLGRWRTSKVPNFSTDPTLAYQIDERMQQLGLSKRYMTELEKLAKAKRLPAEWVGPEQRCRAALKAIAPRASLKVIKR